MLLAYLNFITTMNISIFSEARHLLEEVEARLVYDTNNPIRIIGYLKRLVWLPAKFLHMGISERMRGFFVWALLSFAFLILGAMLLNKLEIKQPEVAQGVLIGAWVVPMFLTLFALPSIFAHGGVSDEMISYIHTHLRDRGFSKTKELDLLKKTIKYFEDRARSRITTFKWIVGLGWGGLTYVFSKGIETSLASPAQLSSHAFMSFLMLLAISAAYLCVWGYEAAIDKLFTTIEFGCNDYAHAIDSESLGAKN